MIDLGTHHRRLAARLACLLAFGLSLPHAAWSTSLQDVLNRGTLRVGVALYTPWAIRTDGGELAGFEIDVGRQLAEDMGVEVEFRVYEWDSIIRALESGEIDIIAAGLSITPERALHVNFSNPYAEGGVNLATNLTTTAEVGRLEDLNHERYKLAVVSQTVAERLAERILPRARRVSFDEPTEASAALIAGEVDAYLEDEPVPTFLALENPKEVDVPLPQPLLRSPTAFAVSKGDPDFLAFLNAWIAARDADTWLPTVRAYWFDSLRWRNQLENARTPRRR